MMVIMTMKSVVVARHKKKQDKLKTKMREKHEVDRDNDMDADVRVSRTCTNDMRAPSVGCDRVSAVSCRSVSRIVG